MTHLNYSLRNNGRTFILEKELLKTEMDHDEIDGDNYKDKKDEWLPYVENEIFGTAFCYARYSKAAEKITGFSMKDCLSLPGLGFKYFNTLRKEEDEPIYTNYDKYMRHFVRQAAYGGRVCAFNQHYISKFCDDNLKIVSQELQVKGNVYDFIEVYMNYKNKHFKIFEKEYENQFNDCRHQIDEEKEIFINEKLSQLPIHKLLQQLTLDEIL